MLELDEKKQFSGKKKKVFGGHFEIF